jgi:hypothetical protein
MMTPIATLLFLNTSVGDRIPLVLLAQHQAISSPTQLNLTFLSVRTVKTQQYDWTETLQRDGSHQRNQIYTRNETLRTQWLGQESLDIVP